MLDFPLPPPSPPSRVHLPIARQMIARQHELFRVTAAPAYKDLPQWAKQHITDAWLDFGRLADDVAMLEQAVDAGSAAVPVRKKRWWESRR